MKGKNTPGVPSSEMGQGDEREIGLLKKLALAGIAIGTAFGGAACSAEGNSKLPQPTSIATEAATNENEESSSEANITPEQMERVRDILVSKVLAKLGELEGKEYEYGHFSTDSRLSIQGDDYPIAGNDKLDNLGIELVGRDSISFSIDNTLKGATLWVQVLEEAAAYRNELYVRRDELTEEQQRLTQENSFCINFTIPGGSLLSGKDLTADDVRNMLNDPKLRVDAFHERLGEQANYVGIGENGALKASYFDASAQKKAVYSTTDSKDVMKKLLGSQLLSVGK